MFNRLEQLVKRYNELNEKLSDPKVIADNLLFQKLSKESSDLVEPVKTYRQYQSIQKHIHQNKELVAHEKDAEIQQMAKEELPELETNLKTLEEKLKILLLPKDPHDDKNVFLEIRAGTGGDEAALFASDLFRMYSKYAESLGW